MEKRRYARPSATYDTLDAFLRSTSTLSLKETYIGDPDFLSSTSSAPNLVTKMDSSRRNSSSSLSSNGQGELIRVPSDSIKITKEKVAGGGRGPPISREKSRPSRGGSTQTSGRTTPTQTKPPKMLSEAAIRVSASLLSKDERFSESPDRLGSVFNAEYNVSPAKHGNSEDASTSLTSERSMRSYPASPKSEQIASSPVRPASPVSGGNRTAEVSSNNGFHFPESPPIAWSVSADAPVPMRRQPLASSAVTDKTEEVTELLKLNAQLEGRIEMLTVEADTAIKERAQYQSELGALKSKLRLYEQKQISDEHLISKEDYASVQKTVTDFQKQNIDLHKQLSAKSGEITRLNENWTSTKELNSKLQSTVSTFAQEIKDKETELVALRSKVKALETQVGSVSDDKQSHVDKITSLQDDITSLTETKEWYQQQLHSSQELRNNLQSELTRLQNLVSNQADVLERVKVENAQIRHQLNDTQHKALAEKQLLIRHLEAIEADMLEREAGFEQLEQEKGLTEYSWQQKMMQIEKERMSLSKMVTQSSELQQDLQRALHNLEAKTAEVEVLETQQEELNRRLAGIQQSEQTKTKELEYTKERLVETESTLQKLQKQDKERGGLLQTLKQDKAKLQIALDSAVEEKKSFSKAVENLKADTARVQQNFKQMKQDLSEKNDRLMQMEKEKTDLTNQVYSMEQEKLQKTSSVSSAEVLGMQKENSALQEHCNHLRASIEDAEDRVERLTVEKRTLEQQLTNMKTNAAELEHILQKSHAEKVSLENKLAEAMDKLQEQAKLRDNDTHLQKQYETQKAKLEQLQNQLTKAESTLKQRVSEHDSSMDLLSKQLQEAIAERDTARRELRQHEETSQANSSSQLENLYAQIQMLRSQLEATQIQKADLEKQISSYHTGVQNAVQEYQKRLTEAAAALTRCQHQLAEERVECEASIERHRSECEKSSQLTIELEKEKGRVAGLQEQHTKLKQHVSDLESALAQRESALVQLNAANLASSRKHDQFDEEQKLKIQQLVEDLSNQTNLCETLQQQLNADRQSRQEVGDVEESLKLELECVKRDLEEKSLALVSAKAELSTTTEMVERQSTNIAMINKEYRTAKMELEQLRRTNSENAARNPIISDEMQALQWQVKQRTQESSDAKNQLQLLEQRMEVETEGLKRALADTKKELESVNLELEGIRKEKFSYQSRVTVIRSSLKNLLNQYKVLKASLPEAVQADEKLLIDEQKYEELLKETSAPGYKSKPLENLKSCLSSLHSEMNTLQQHMDQHKNALKANTESWKVVETEVADLEKLIQASREASKARYSSANNSRVGENII